MTTIFWPFGQRPGVMVKWSKIFDHDHGQNFKIAVVKWSKWPFLTMTMSKIQEFPWSNGQNWSIWPSTMGTIEGVMVMVNVFERWPWGKFQGVMVMVSALPPPPPPLINATLAYLWWWLVICWCVLGTAKFLRLARKMVTVCKGMEESHLVQSVTLRVQCGT